MDRARINRLLTQAQQKIAKGGDPDAVKGLLLGSLMELGFTDPFASQIDEYLAEKGEPKKDDPQEKLEVKLEEEKVPQKEAETQSPETEIQDKMQDEGVPEGKTPEEEAPQDKLEDKLVEEDPSSKEAYPEDDLALEAKISEALTRIAKEAERRNYPGLSKKLLRVAGSGDALTGALNELLARENRLLRFLELSHYVFVNPNHRLAFEVIDKQTKSSTEWRDFLTQKIIEAGGVPTLEHAPIAAPSPLNIENLMKLEISLLQEDLVLYKQVSPSLSHLATELQNAMTLKLEVMVNLERALKVQ
jgi:hypothetical protein